MPKTPTPSSPADEPVIPERDPDTEGAPDPAWLPGKDPDVGPPPMPGQEVPTKM